MTRRCVIDSENPDPQVILKIASLIQEGKLVILPTDTAYGLVGNPSNASVVERVVNVKGRIGKPGLPLLAETLTQVQTLGELSTIAQTLAYQFWPGGLTLIVPARQSFPQGILGPENSIAIRIPNHPVTNAVIHATGYPIIGTSANKSDAPSPRTATAAESQLGDLVELIVDGGPTHHTMDSTIVNCTKTPPEILREGAVSAASIKVALTTAQK